MKPEAYQLGRLDWQFFCTFSFKSLKISDGVKVKMYFALVREQADNFRIHFKKTLWALRHELGEKTGRPHFHALIAGFPNSCADEATCFAFKKLWEKHGGGNARVFVYDPRLKGVEYVLDGAEQAIKRAGGNWYELNKFGGRCDVMLSESLIRRLSNRQVAGQRGKGDKRDGWDRHVLEHTADMTSSRTAEIRTLARMGA
jgi:hypothetical protein